MAHHDTNVQFHTQLNSHSHHEPGSPSRVAVVDMPCRSVPAPGSVRPRPLRRAPVADSGRHFAFCSGVPFFEFRNKPWNASPRFLQHPSSHEIVFRKQFRTLSCQRRGHRTPLEWSFQKVPFTSCAQRWQLGIRPNTPCRAQLE